ncbi:BRO family protein [Azomonas agilis]|uniref:BRO family protein n=1 Tax=Azomonas agilis TaxID=116849 RepID=A0A562HZ58_9GAMM|nr:BRO family protein [Azomonas agilis]TWH63886.1 BRO family protein [Azomonas agilis]
MQAAQVIPFNFGKVEVRTLIIDDQPWFVAKDVIYALDYARSSSPAKLIDHVPAQWKGVNQIHTLGGSQKLLMLSEQGLYFFIGRSDKPKALPFQMWLAGEVLPAIRKHGRYEDTSGKMDTLLNSTIGTDGFHCLAAVLDGKLRHLPTKARQRAKMHVWSQVHKAFSVVSAEDIPATQLDSARNFIAAYNVHEGEWLGKEPTINPTLNELDLAMLYVFCIDTLELVYVGEKLKPVFETLRAPLTMNVRKCLGECREAVAHLHERFGPQMEQAARRRKAFDGRLNLAAAGDHSQPIWTSGHAQDIRG